MNGWTIAAGSVLAAGVGVSWLSVIGLMRCRDAFDRLHFSGLVSLWGPLAIAAALVLAQGFGSASLRAWLLVALLIPTSGVMSHAIARAEWLRRENRRADAGEGAEVHDEMA